MSSVDPPYTTVSNLCGGIPFWSVTPVLFEKILTLLTPLTPRTALTTAGLVAAALDAVVLEALTLYSVSVSTSVPSVKAFMLLRLTNPLGVGEIEVTVFFSRDSSPASTATTSIVIVRSPTIGDVLKSTRLLRPIISRLVSYPMYNAPF